MASHLSLMDTRKKWPFDNPECVISEKSGQKVRLQDAISCFLIFKNNLLPEGVHRVELVLDTDKKEFYYKYPQRNNFEQHRIKNISLQILEGLKKVQEGCTFVVERKAPHVEDAMDLDESPPQSSQTHYKDLMRQLDTVTDFDKYRQLLTEIKEQGISLHPSLQKLTLLRARVFLQDFILRDNRSIESAKAYLEFIQSYIAIYPDCDDTSFKTLVNECCGKIRTLDASFDVAIIDIAGRLGVQELIEYFERNLLELPGIRGALVRALMANGDDGIKKALALYERDEPIFDERQHQWFYNQKIRYTLRCGGVLYKRLIQCKSLLPPEWVQGADRPFLFTPELPPGKAVAIGIEGPDGMKGLSEFLLHSNKETKSFVTQEEADTFFEEHGFLVCIPSERYNDLLKKDGTGILKRWIHKIVIHPKLWGDFQKLIGSYETKKLMQHFEDDRLKSLSYETVQAYRSVLLEPPAVVGLAEKRDRVPSECISKEELQEIVEMEVLAANGECQKLVANLTDALYIQDLITTDDATFNKWEILQCALALGIPVHAWEKTKAGHGHDVDTGKETTLWGHHVLVLTGKDEMSFGLRTDILQEHKKHLRLAALLHDSGKLVFQGETPTFVRDQHVPRSSEYARTLLKEQKALFGIDDDDIELIASLILYNDLFGRYFKGHISYEQLEVEIRTAFDALPASFKNTKASEKLYHELLFTLYLADASTLSIVRHKDTFLQAHSLLGKRRDPVNKKYLEGLRA